jgi:transcriptional regulator with XRE-family HTH domain
MSDFADNLRALMAKRGWNQQEAADALSVSQANISRWLSRGHEPSADVLIRIAAAFGVTLDELLRASGTSMRTARAELDTVVWPPAGFVNCASPGSVPRKNAAASKPPSTSPGPLKSQTSSPG